MTYTPYYPGGWQDSPSTSTPITAAALNNLESGLEAASPMTAAGDTIYGGASGVATRLAGNITTTRKFYRQTGTGSVANNPAWDTLQVADIPQLADYAPSGLTGATAASRYVGATASGAPVSGTFEVGDFIVDQTGAMWVCTTAGSPGTWTEVAGGGGGGSVNSVTAGDLSVSVNNTDPANPTIESGTLDHIASLHPAAADWSNNSHKITGVTSGAASGEVVEFSQLPGTANPLPINAGGTGQITRQAALNALAGGTTASQVLAGNGTNITLRALVPSDIPSLSATYALLTGAAFTGAVSSTAFELPYEFYPETYGAKGDGRMVTDASITASSTTLTCATSTPFVPGDVGKYVLIWSAAADGWWHFTTIASYTSSSVVTLTDAAGSTVSSVGMVFGTDDTAAFNSCVTAMNTRSLQGNGKSAEMILDDKIYCIAGAATKGGATAGNAQIPLPVIDATVGPKSQLKITGTGPAQLLHWTQPQPLQSGSIILGMRVDGSLDLTDGPTSIIGGPVAGYGGGGGTFSNMCLTIDGVTLMVPASKNAYCGVDAFGLGQTVISGGYSYLPIAVVPSQTVWPSLNDLGGPSNYPAYSFGIRMGANGNNAVEDADAITTYWTQISVIGSEHFSCTNLRTLFSQYGILPMSSGGGTMSHGMRVGLWTCEAVRDPLGSVNTGYFVLNAPISIVVNRIDLESYDHLVDDQAAKLYGIINFSDQVGPEFFYTGSLFGSGSAEGVKLVHIEALQGAVASDPSVPSTGTAQLNGYYRDATVNVQPNGATVSAISVGGTALTGITSGLIRVPSGKTITLDYTVATPAWQWLLD